MPDVELKSSVCEGRVVVALRGDLDVTGVPALTGRDEAFWVQPSVAAVVAGIPGRGTWRRRPVSTARPGRAASSPVCSG